MGMFCYAIKLFNNTKNIMGQIKRLFHAFLSKAIGFVIFLILLAIANLLINFIHNSMYVDTVNFVDMNLLLITTFTIILLIGEIFEVLVFPFNLPGPLFSAVGGIIIVRFLINVFSMMNSMLNLGLNWEFDFVYYIVSIIVFIFVIILGYAKLISESRTRKVKKKKR